MAKLKNIIKQLSEKDFTAIYNSLIESRIVRIKEKNREDVPDGWVHCVLLKGLSQLDLRFLPTVFLNAP